MSDKEFDQLINISHHSLIMMNAANTEFTFVEVWFTVHWSKQQANWIEDNASLALITG